MSVDQEVERTMCIEDIVFGHSWINAPSDAPYAAGLNFSGYAYYIAPHGLLHKAIDAFGLKRLRHIHQFGYLSPWGIRARSKHNRYDHVCNVAMLATVIAEYNRHHFTQPEINALRLAAICHDAMTPAGGDAVKSVDYDALDEDSHFHELLERTDWQHIRDEYDIDPALVLSIIRNEGALGQILDLADKIAYVSRDVTMFASKAYPHYEAKYDQVNEYLSQNPNACILASSITVSRHAKNVALIINPFRFAQFLTLRGLMFRHCYYNPVAHMHEHMYARTVVRHLYRSGALTRDMLLTMTDDELNHRVEEFLGRPWWNDDGTPLGTPHMEHFADKTQALARLEELRSHGVVFSFASRGLLDETLKPLSLYKSYNSDGALLNFEQIMPVEAARIRATTTVTEPWNVYYLTDPKVHPTVVSLLSSL